MSRYLLIPTSGQATVMREHCAHARFVWNLAVEQQSWWRRGRTSAPGYPEQCRQLTAARAENDWLRAGSQTVQQQALRDFDQAMRSFFTGTHRKPGFRKASRSNGFRIVKVRPEHVRKLNRRRGEVWIPKVGWVRFRWSRDVPHAKSYRVNCDGAGRWHIAFAAIPAPIPGPGTGDVVGVDRGVAVSTALSTGEMLNTPRPSAEHRRRLLILQRKLARAQRGSNRRAKVKLAIALAMARETDARKDWCEKLSTDLARRFDVIRVEDLKVKSMTRSA
jgi:putative transposase